MSISEKLLAEFDEEFSATRKFLERVPEDKLTWKPHEKSMELGRLAWHLADFPSWCIETLKKDVLQFTDADGAAHMQAREGKGRADMLAQFDADLAVARSLLADADDDRLTGRWRMEWNGQVVIEGTREQVLRRWTMNHMIHHRAQFGVYLRLNDIAVPGPYGGSADEMGA